MFNEKGVDIFRFCAVQVVDELTYGTVPSTFNGQFNAKSHVLTIGTNTVPETIKTGCYGFNLALLHFIHLYP